MNESKERVKILLFSEKVIPSKHFMQKMSVLSISVKHRFNSDMVKYYFYNSIYNESNMLPESIVMSISVNELLSTLENMGQ